MSEYYQFKDETGTPIDYYQLVNDNNELCKEIKQLKSELKQKEKIIKEIRELCENQFIMWEVNNLGGKIKIYAPISTDKIMEILGDNDE